MTEEELLKVNGLKESLNIFKFSFNEEDKTTIDISWDKEGDLWIEERKKENPNFNEEDFFRSLLTIALEKLTKND